VTAIKENARLEDERIKNMAVAVRAGFADEEGWKAFLKDHPGNA
jgi:hypothetical protein